MDKVYVGKIVSTHGIKGEIRILSNFQFKSKVFVVGKKIIIDDKDYVIKSYRHHKNFEMVTLNEYNDINLEYFHRALDLLLLYTDFNWMFLDEILESAKSGNKHRASVNLKRISKKLRKQMKY